MVGPIASPSPTRRAGLLLLFVASMATSLLVALPATAQGPSCSATTPPPTYSPPWTLVSRACGNPETDTSGLCPSGVIRWCEDQIFFDDGHHQAMAWAIYTECLACGGHGGGPGGTGGPIEH